MTSSMAPQAAPEPVREAPLRWRAPYRILALLPLWLFLILVLPQQSLSQPLMSQPPGLLGLPLGVWMTLLVGAWTLAGLALVWNARSPLLRVLAIFVFTIPATFLMILGPAVILILQNLG